MLFVILFAFLVYLCIFGYVRSCGGPDNVPASQVKVLFPIQFTAVLVAILGALYYAFFQ